jgi:uncharacterized membrane protein
LNRAKEVLTTLSQLRHSYMIDQEDACCITKDAQGKVNMHQVVPTTRVGALGGAFFGGFIGLMLGAVLQPNTSPLMVLVQRSTPDKVLPELSEYGGTVERTSLSKENEAKPQAALTLGVAAQIGSKSTTHHESRARDTT